MSYNNSNMTNNMSNNTGNDNINSIKSMSDSTKDRSQSLLSIVSNDAQGHAQTSPALKPHKMTPTGGDRSSSKKDVVYPVEPRVLQAFKKPRTHANHSYRDFSCVPAEGKDATLPSSIDEMSFNQKVYHILSCEEYAKYISWLPHGRSFRIRKYLSC
jgi:hypothetical protein